MALVTMREMLLAARKEHRAVGAFNVGNYETARAVLLAAERENQPVIIQVYNRLFDSEKAFDLAGALLRLAHRGRQPVALHLDHGATVKQVKDALAWACGWRGRRWEARRIPRRTPRRGAGRPSPSTARRTTRPESSEVSLPRS